VPTISFTPITTGTETSPIVGIELPTACTILPEENISQFIFDWFGLNFGIELCITQWHYQFDFFGLSFDTETIGNLIAFGLILAWWRGA